MKSNYSACFLWTKSMSTCDLESKHSCKMWKQELHADCYRILKNIWKWKGEIWQICAIQKMNHRFWAIWRQKGGCIIPVSTQKSKRTQDQDCQNMSYEMLSNREYVHFKWYQTYIASFKPTSHDELFINRNFIESWEKQRILQCNDWNKLIEVCKITSSKYFIKEITTKFEENSPYPKIVIECYNCVSTYIDNCRRRPGEDKLMITIDWDKIDNEEIAHRRENFYCCTTRFMCSLR